MTEKIKDTRMRECRICGKPSFGKQHKHCEFPSVQGAKRRVSVRSAQVKHNEKRKLSRRKAALNLIEFAGVEGVGI